MGVIAALMSAIGKGASSAGAGAAGAGAGAGAAGAGAAGAGAAGGASAASSLGSALNTASSGASLMKMLGGGGDKGSFPSGVTTTRQQPRGGGVPTPTATQFMNPPSMGSSFGGQSPQALLALMRLLQAP